MARDANIGREIGRYKIVQEIGRGGMAVVYSAIDLSLEREVALKLLHPHLASHAESRNRFRREAQAVARLKHPNVAEIYDYSDDETDDIFLVMELVEGSTLRRFLDERTDQPVFPEAALLIIRQVCEALMQAHNHGIVHRDVKPENILIGTNGIIKLSDFGIAHLADSSNMTSTGQILGSTAYMSPEQIEHTSIDARADIFAVGTVLYEAIIGRTPFEGNTPHAVIKKIIEGDFQDPTQLNPSTGYWVGQILRRCLKTDPRERYESCEKLLEDIDRALCESSIEPGQKNLEKIFTDPDLWVNEHLPKIISCTLASGLSARRSKQSREAMDHFNRVLALEPGNTRALEAVAGLTRRSKLITAAKRLALILPILVVICAAGWTAARHNPKPQINNKQAAPIDADTGQLADSAPIKKLPLAVSDTDKSLITDSDSAAAPIHRKRVTLRPITKVKLAKREVVFTPYPGAVQIVIDDKKKFAYAPSTRKHTLTVGKHKISILPNDPNKFETKTWIVNIPKGDGLFNIRKRLEWKPATLLVKCNTDATVSVPGKASGRANQNIKVPIKKGPEEEASVIVSAEGYNTGTRRVTISAGERTAVTIPLTKTQ